MKNPKTIQKPIISVIIPAFNEELYIGNCLSSLMKQQGCSDFEVVVVDNNSTDNTAKIVKKYPVKLVTEKVSGVVKARQCGLSKAKGNIIVSTDADCVFKPYWLANIERFYIDNPQAVGLAGHYYFYKSPLWALVFPTMCAVLVWILYYIFGKTIYASAANLSFRKIAFNKGYNTKYFQGADERGVVNEVSKYGKFHVTLRNPVYTSSRRVNQGFLYSIFITLGYYYIYNVIKTNKTGESPIGGHPIIRHESRMHFLPIIIFQWFIFTIILVIVWYIMFK